MLHRIHFDVNEGDEQDRFDLGIPGSLNVPQPRRGCPFHVREENFRADNKADARKARG
jgi:hypothetical protein